jgi:hypothetical protein
MGDFDRGCAGGQQAVVGESLENLPSDLIAVQVELRDGGAPAGNSLAFARPDES